MADSEYTWPTWVDYIFESMEHFIYVMVEFISMIFGPSSNTSDPPEETENFFEKTLFFVQNIIGTVSFDHFQMQLLKIFVLILISTGILICAAWHIYGQRICERFMHSSRETRAGSPSTSK